MTRKTLYAPTTGNLRQSANFMRNPVALPARVRVRSYRVQDDDGGSFEVFLDGEYRASRVPNGQDARVLYAFLQIAKRTKRGRWVASFESGQALFDAMNAGEFGSGSTKRIWQALKNWADLVIDFEGTYSVPGGRSGLPLSKRFHVLDNIKKRKDQRGRWRFRVVFNDEFVREILNGQVAALHLPTYRNLDSDFARRLLEYLSAILNRQNETQPLKIDKLFARLGLQNSTTLRYNSEKIERIRDAIDEINRRSVRNNRLYRVRVVKVKNEKRLRFSRHDIRGHSDD